jgi:hypothetical protein
VTQVALRRKRSWLSAAIATLVLCAAAAWFLWPTGHRITVETYERLRPGMTRGEVEDALGGPGGTRQDFSRWLNNRSPTTGSGTDLLNEHRDQPGIEYWYQDGGVIILRFDSDGRLADTQFLQMRVSTSRQRVIRLRERIGW